MKTLILFLLFIVNAAGAAECDSDAYAFKAAKEGEYTNRYMYQRLNACRSLPNTIPLVDEELSALIMAGEGEYQSDDQRFLDATQLVVTAAEKGSETALNWLIGDFRYGSKVRGVEIVEKNPEVASCLVRLRSQSKIDGKGMAECLPKKYLTDRK